MKRGKIFVIFMFVIIGMLVFLNFKTSSPFTNTAAKTNTDNSFIGKRAQDFNITTIDGTKFRLSEKKGKTVILFGFATWCSDCIQDAKTLSKIKQEYKNKGIEIIGVAFTKGETLDSLKRFQKLGNLIIPLALDTDNVAEKYKLVSVGTKYIINKNGFIVFYTDQENTDEKTYQKELNKIL